MQEKYQAPYLIPQIATATDIIIEYTQDDKSGIILIERRYPPIGLALPGGFTTWGLDFEKNAEKEAKEETGLTVRLKSPEHPMCVHSRPDRDPRGHIASFTYIAQGSGELKAGDDAKEARLYSLHEVQELLDSNALVFDHDRTLKEYLCLREFK
jgi:ADP-ribose pyrophosphatase YjhB (NUDIX family)